MSELSFMTFDLLVSICFNISFLLIIHILQLYVLADFIQRIRSPCQTLEGSTNSFKQAFTALLLQQSLHSCAKCVVKTSSHRYPPLPYQSSPYLTLPYLTTFQTLLKCSAIEVFTCLCVLSCPSKIDRTLHPFAKKVLFQQGLTLALFDRSRNNILPAKIVILTCVHGKNVVDLSFSQIPFGNNRLELESLYEHFGLI